MTRSARYSYAEWERVRDEGIPASYALACAIYIPAFLIASMVAEIVIGVTDAPSSSWSLELHILELSGAPAVAAVAIVWVQNRTRAKAARSGSCVAGPRRLRVRSCRSRRGDPFPWRGDGGAGDDGEG
jgi:hypothetical protein